MADEILFAARKRSGRLGVHRRVRPAIAALLLALLPTSLAAAGPPPDPFAARGVRGAFVLLDVSTETWTIVHRDVAEWNRDTDLAAALKYSVVWFYQEVARRVGARRMAAWVDKLGYGNRRIAGAPIDRFWLDGPLRISAIEQVEFLRRLHEHRLPVSRAHVDLLLRLLELDRGPGWVLRGKTGLGRERDGASGWLVGSVDRGGRRYLYALVLHGSSTAALLPLRRPMADELLRRFGVLPAT